ncbi:hypothetical protein ACFT7S_19425 [Streptomyces sp. NPDC057136]|uniref:hypothetical protein n=1 Tax=Streptomyces sp. NPDC057136 TaxID=3346029 RepID=UPI003627A81B
MNDNTSGQKARELLTQASQHPVASPQRDALVAEAAVWARLEHAAVIERHSVAAVDIESALASFADPVRKLGSEIGNLTEHIKLSQK